MFLVAATVGVCAFGAWAGKDLSFGWAIGFFIVGFAALIGLQFVRKNHTLALTLLFVVGAALGLGIGPTVQAYADAFGARGRCPGGRSHRAVRGRVRHLGLRDPPGPGADGAATCSGRCSH